MQQHLENLKKLTTWPISRIEPDWVDCWIMWRFFQNVNQQKEVALSFCLPVSGYCFPLMETRNWRNEQMVRKFLTAHVERKSISIFRGGPQFQDRIIKIINRMLPMVLKSAKWRALPQMTETSVKGALHLFSLRACCDFDSTVCNLFYAHWCTSSCNIFLCHLLPFVVWIYYYLRSSFLCCLLSCTHIFNQPIRSSFYCPGARFSKTPETFPACKAIFT